MPQTKDMQELQAVNLARNARCAVQSHTFHGPRLLGALLVSQQAPCRHVK